MNELESRWWEHLSGENNGFLKRENETKYQKYKEWLDRFDLKFDSEKYLDFDEIFSRKINKYISNTIHANDHGYCLDNLRIATVSNEEEEYFYHKRKDNGCCGFWDDEIEIDGVKLMIGWNYGH